MGTTIDEIELIGKIAERAQKIAEEQGYKTDQLSWFMDIEAAHLDIGLDLTGLLNADNFNFTHDISGIHVNLNHTTRKLENEFLPRYHRK